MTRKLQLDEINSEIIDYMTRRGKVKAREIAEVVGITVPSIRVRLFQLMAKGIVKKESTRDRQVWFSVQEVEKHELVSSYNDIDGSCQRGHLRCPD